MRKESTRSPSESRAHWEDLEEWVRGQIQGLIQELLEEEITELLGRAKSARRSTLDGASGYRNGYGKPRRLTLSSGTIQVRRPRVRNVEKRFERRVLPLFARISSSQSDGNIVMWHVFGDPTLELWTGKPLRILPEIFTILLREANRWRIEYEVEGAIITILQGGVPVGRAPVINGVADIPLIRDLDLQVPVGGLQISASMPGEVSAGLGAPSVSADLAVTKTAAPSSIVVGENITYAIAVTNQGPDQATGVFVEDFLPQGVTFVSVSSSQGDCFQQTAGIACELGDLPPGTTATVELVGKATQAGTVNNSATATGDEDDPDTANNSGQVSVTIGTG